MQGTPGKVSKDHRLTINSVGRDDRGEYTCTAANSEGESRQTLSLSVFCKYATETLLRIRLIKMFHID